MGRQAFVGHGEGLAVNSPASSEVFIAVHCAWMDPPIGERGGGDVKGVARPPPGGCLRLLEPEAPSPLKGVSATPPDVGVRSPPLAPPCVVQKKRSERSNRKAVSRKRDRC